MGRIAESRHGPGLVGRVDLAQILPARLHALIGIGPQLSRYALVSLAALVLDFSLYLALTSGGMKPVLAGVIGYAAGTVLHYVLSARFVFDAAATDKVQARLFGEFALSGLVGIGITALVIALATGAPACRRCRPRCWPRPRASCWCSPCGETSCSRGSGTCASAVAGDLRQADGWRAPRCSSPRNFVPESPPSRNTPPSRNPRSRSLRAAVRVARCDRRSERWIAYWITMPEWFHKLLPLWLVPTDNSDRCGDWQC